MKAVSATSRMNPLRPPFRIKVCGVRSSVDVQAASDAGADAVGLNFHPPSIRYLDPKSESVRWVLESARDSKVNPIGLFVNVSTEHVCLVANQLGLATIQLHGDERPCEAEEIISQGYQVIRAIRLPPNSLSTEYIEKAVEPWVRLGCQILFDVDTGGSYGGSGGVLDWPSLGRWVRDRDNPVPWVLAGGLRPETVASAISQAKPDAIDVASGTEQPRGTKSPQRMQAFCRAALAQWVESQKSK